MIFTGVHLKTGFKALLESENIFPKVYFTKIANNLIVLIQIKSHYRFAGNTTYRDCQLNKLFSDPAFGEDINFFINKK